ncbi:MAG TPA: hypothetical protein VFI47_15430 [Acidimicrobiales bacterium]|nr:hypothetical protein [Acidimicrobiales bacterium]
MGVAVVALNAVGSIAAGVGSLLIFGVSTNFLPLWVERSGAVLAIRYVFPRTRSFSTSRVRGLAIERWLWMTRIEFDTTYVVLPGWVRGVETLLA